MNKIEIAKANLDKIVQSLQSLLLDEKYRGIEEIWAEADRTDDWTSVETLLDNLKIPEDIQKATLDSLYGLNDEE